MDSLSLNLGSSVQLAATVVDAAGNAVTGATITWTPGDTVIASVTGGGLVAGLRSGRTVLQASSGSLSLNVPVTILAPIHLNPVSVFPGLTPMNIAISAGGDIYVAGFGLGLTVAGISLLSGQVTSMIPVSVPTNDVTFDFPGTTAYTANSTGNAISIIDVGSSRVVSTITVRDVPQRVLVSRDGRSLFALVGLDHSSLTIIDISSRSIVADVSITGRSPQAMVSQGDSIIYICSPGGRIDRVDVRNHLFLGSQVIASGADADDIAISPDGTLLYVADEGFSDANGNVDIVSAATGALVTRLSIGGADINGIALDEPYLYVSTTAGVVQIWDRARQTMLNVISVGGMPGHMAVDPHSRGVAVTNLNGSVDIIR